MGMSVWSGGLVGLAEQGERAKGGGANVGRELIFGAGKIFLDLPKPLLEDGNVTNTAINGVAEPRVSFIGERIGSIFSLIRREVAQDLGDVARLEDPVNMERSYLSPPPSKKAALENLGNTCFLNVVLQCLTHTVPLVQKLPSVNHSSTCSGVKMMNSAVSVL